MPTGVRLAYAVHGDRRSLEERWHLTAAQLRSVGGRELPPICEENLVLMRAEIERMTPVPAAVEPLLRAAREEFSALRRRYATAWGLINELQSKIARAVDDPMHQITGDIPFDWDFVFDKINLGSGPKFTNVPDVREAIRDFQPRVTSIEGRRAQLASALAFAHQAPEEINRALILALFKRITALEQEQAKTAAAPAPTQGEEILRAVEAENQRLRELIAAEEAERTSRRRRK